MIPIEDTWIPITEPLTKREHKRKTIQRFGFRDISCKECRSAGLYDINQVIRILYELKELADAEEPFGRIEAQMVNAYYSLPRRERTRWTTYLKMKPHMEELYEACYPLRMEEDLEFLVQSYYKDLQRNCERCLKRILGEKHITGTREPEYELKGFESRASSATR